MRKDVMAAYLEKLLSKITETDRVVADDDGDYPVRFRSALYYVRLVGESCPDVQVFAVAVDGIKPSPELLAEINEINTQVRFVRVFHVRDQVLIETDLIGDAIEPLAFGNACEAVAQITDRVGPALASTFGGRTPFDDAKDADYGPPAQPVGMYL